jgi:hypothetical protein
LFAISPALTFQLMKRFSKNCCENWRYRTQQVLACPDNAYVSRVPEAGEIRGDFQIMHNGLKVLLGSYYGKDSVRLLKKNRGVHEPQEERIFQEVLPKIPPGSVMIELGAYWGYYSMWFCKNVPNARAYLIEPVAENLEFGRRNFAANGLAGAHFTRAWVGQKSGVAEDGTKVLCVDDFVAEQKIEHVAILHSDIQGFEVQMLKGAQSAIRAGRISYCFISTHDVELHRACETFLRGHGFEVVASISPPESYSVDGILVCRWPSAPAIPELSISRRAQR